MASKWEDVMHNVSDVASDLGDLIAKEIRLARAEVAHNVMQRLRGSALAAAAGVVILLAVLFALQGVVLLIASTGISLHASCFIVTAALLIVAGAVYLAARNGLATDLAPARTSTQVQKDVQTLKESFQ